jgi:hypothetical protein
MRIASTLITTYLLPGSYYHYLTPRTIHINDITTSNLDAYISTYQNTLIKIDTAQFSEQDTTFADGPLKTDRSLHIQDRYANSIVIRSSGYANFATSQVPAGNGSIIAVLQIYNSSGSNQLTDLQIKIRDLSDLNMVNLRYPIEDFEGQTPNTDISIPGWLNLAIAGTKKWQAKEYSNNRYAEATAYNTSLSNMETWLITSAINLSTVHTLTFQSAQAYWNYDCLSVLISTNFNGTNVAAATWTQLPCTLAGSTDANYAFVSSGNVSLTSFSGTGYIAFKYSGSDPSQTTTYQIDNVIVH